MINKLPIELKGKALGLWPDEAVELFYAAPAETILYYNDHCEWVAEYPATWAGPHISRHNSMCFWTDWERPEMKQPANLPEGWIAYPVVWHKNGWYVRISTTHEIRQSNIQVGYVHDGRVLCQWFAGDRWDRAVNRMDAPCDPLGFADWAIFRPLPNKEG